MIVNIAALGAMIAAYIGVFSVISFGVLYLVGKVFPLVGRRR